jgi:hypothetical protein
MASLLSLPNETLLEIIDKHRPTDKGISFLCNLNLVCKQLRDLSLPHLYRRVSIYGDPAMYLFLRSLVSNPQLQRIVQVLRLEWTHEGYDYSSDYGYEPENSESETEEPFVISKWSKKEETLHRTYPPADEIHQIRAYAISNGLEGEREYIQKIGIKNDAGIQVRAIVLLLSLPCLRAFHFTHDHKVRHFDTLFTKLALDQQQKTVKFLPSLTSFQREIADHSIMANTMRPFVGIGQMATVMLTPSIQTATMTWALMPKVAKKFLNLRDLLTEKSLRRVSSIRALSLLDCDIDNADLGLILQFPRDLRSLTISMSTDTKARLKSILAAIKKHVSHSLEQLVLCCTRRMSIDQYPPREIFRSFTRLGRLSVNIELLVGPGSRALGDIRDLLPPALVYLSVFLPDAPSEPQVKMLEELIDGIITAKEGEKVSILKIGFKSSSWERLGVEALTSFHERAQGVGISFVIASFTNPFRHTALDLDKLLAKPLTE